ncbi:hypothetical protein ACI1TH_02180 [Lactococcus petauri]|uniref:hypothetical protein n=1 Tax=Lactococcus petauri TaxID=1940789 RepID=UPI0038539B78
MRPEKKRKLRNIALLALLGLIGGTFAFAAFNQQAINDRLRENRADYGGRVHDYFNSDSGNKDVFVENFGQEPIIVRLKLSEFMAIQERGSDDWEPVVPGTEREDLESWTTYIPEETNVSQRRSIEGIPSADFNDYSNLTFGWTRGGEDAPWYLPTFNTVYDDPVTAAAGHARDLSYVRDGEVYPRATHPGDGKDGYWSQGESYTNTGQWPGTTGITRETAQNLEQRRAPMTLQEWQNLPWDSRERVGNYWVMDEATGWAYYAIALHPGEATSYLLDAAQMLRRAHNIQGSYYYGIHVTSELIGAGKMEDDWWYHEGPRFSDEDDASPVLELFLQFVRTTAFNNSNTNIEYQLLDHLFDRIQPGQRFRTFGDPFLYLGPVAGEEQDGHMILSIHTMKGFPWDAQDIALESYWNHNFPPELKERVLPVVIPEQDAAPGVNADDLEWGLFPGWRPTNLENWPDVANDLTNINSAGEPQVFALSMADVMRFSPTFPDRPLMLATAFPTFQSRVAGEYDNEWWFTRTPADENTAWGIDNGRHGPLGGFAAYIRNYGGASGGVRPAFIIRAGTVSE